VCDSIHFRARDEAIERSIRPMMRKRIPCKKGSAKPKTPSGTKTAPVANTSALLISLGIVNEKIPRLMRGVLAYFLFFLGFFASFLCALFPFAIFFERLTVNKLTLAQKNAH